MTTAPHPQRVQLVADRPSIYASPVGAVAEVTALTETLVRVHWLWAARNEHDGWYSARDFETI